MSVQDWSWTELTSMTVPVVSGHHTLPIFADRLAFFGGFDSNGSARPFNSVSTIDLKTNHHHELIVTSSIVPSTRVGSSMTLGHSYFSPEVIEQLKNTDLLYPPVAFLFGGTLVSTCSPNDASTLSSIPRMAKAAKDLLNDLYAFSFFDQSWVCLSGSNKIGHAPSPRLGASLVASPMESGAVSSRQPTTSLILTGGYDGKQIHSLDMHVFNLTSKLWSAVNITGQIPASRFGHSCTWVSYSKITNKMDVEGQDDEIESNINTVLFIFGGASQQQSTSSQDNELQALSDCWTLNVSDLISVQQSTTLSNKENLNCQKNDFQVSGTQKSFDLGIGARVGHTAAPLLHRKKETGQVDQEIAIIGGETATGGKWHAANPAVSVIDISSMSARSVGLLPFAIEGSDDTAASNAFMKRFGHTACVVPVCTLDEGAIERYPAPHHNLSTVSTAGIFIHGGCVSPACTLLLPASCGLPFPSCEPILPLDKSIRHLPASCFSLEGELKIKSALMDGFQARLKKALNGLIVAAQVHYRLRVENTQNDFSSWRHLMHAKFAPDLVSLLLDFKPCILPTGAAPPPSMEEVLAGQPLVNDVLSSEDEVSDPEQYEIWPSKEQDFLDGDGSVFATEALTVRRLNPRSVMVDDVSNVVSITKNCEFGLPRLLQLRRALMRELARTPQQWVELFGAAPFRPIAPDEEINLELSEQMASAASSSSNGLSNITRLYRKIRRRELGLSSLKRTHPLFVRTGLSETVFHASIEKESDPNKVASSITDAIGMKSWRLGALLSLLQMPFLHCSTDIDPSNLTTSVKYINTIRGRRCITLDSFTRGLSPLEVTTLIRETGGMKQRSDFELEPNAGHQPWPSAPAVVGVDTTLGIKFQTAVTSLASGALVLTKTNEAISMGLYSLELLAANSTANSAVPGAGEGENPLAPISLPVASLPLQGLAANGRAPRIPYKSFDEANILSSSADLLSNIPKDQNSLSNEQNNNPYGSVASAIASFFIETEPHVAVPSLGANNASPWFADAKAMGTGGALHSGIAVPLNQRAIAMNKPRNASSSNNESQVGSGIVGSQNDATLDKDEKMNSTSNIKNENRSAVQDSADERQSSQYPYAPKCIVAPPLGVPLLAAQALIHQFGPFTSEELAAEVLKLYNCPSPAATRVVLFDLHFDGSVLASTEFDVRLAPVTHKQQMQFAANIFDETLNCHPGPVSKPTSISPPAPCFAPANYVSPQSATVSALTPQYCSYSTNQPTRECVRVLQPTPLGTFSTPVSFASVKSIVNSTAAIRSIQQVNYNTEDSTKAQSAFPSPPGLLNDQGVYISGALGSIGLRPSLSCLLDHSRLEIDAGEGSGGVIPASVCALNPDFPFWRSLLYGPDYSLSTAIFWNFPFVAGSILKVQNRFVLPVPKVEDARIMQKLACEPEALINNGDCLSAIASIPAASRRLPGTSAAKIGENDCWVRPFDTIKASLHRRIELPFFKDPVDFAQQGWVLMGFLNTPTAAPAAQRKPQHDLCESGILLYSRGKLICRLDLPFPAHPSLSEAFLPLYDENDDMLMPIASIGPKGGILPVTVLVGVPIDWEVAPCGTKFAAEGSLAWQKLREHIIVNIVTPYLNCIRFSKTITLTAASQIEKESEIEKNLKAIELARKRQLALWVQSLTKSERGEILLYHGSRRYRCADDLESIQPIHMRRNVMLPRADHHHPAHPHAGPAIMDNDKSLAVRHASHNNSSGTAINAGGVNPAISSNSNSNSCAQSNNINSNNVNNSNGNGSVKREEDDDDDDGEEEEDNLTTAEEEEEEIDELQTMNDEQLEEDSDSNIMQSGKRILGLQEDVNEEDEDEGRALRNEDEAPLPKRTRVQGSRGF